MQLPGPKENLLPTLAPGHLVGESCTACYTKKDAAGKLACGGKREKLNHPPGQRESGEAEKEANFLLSRLSPVTGRRRRRRRIRRGRSER